MGPVLRGGKRVAPEAMVRHEGWDPHTEGLNSRGRPPQVSHSPGTLKTPETRSPQVRPEWALKRRGRDRDSEDPATEPLKNSKDFTKSTGLQVQRPLMKLCCL
jgi:hypothetical protein